MVPRKHFTISQKFSLVKTLEKRQRENNESFRSVARDLGVHPSQLRRWKEQVPKFKELLTKGPNGRRPNTNAKSVHSGRKSCLHNMEEDLLKFIMKNREQGKSVSIQMLTTEASRLDGNFCRKTAAAKDSAVRRFVDSHDNVQASRRLSAK